MANTKTTKADKPESQMSAQEIAAAQREAQLRELLSRDTDEIIADRDLQAGSPVGRILNADPAYHYYVLDVTGLIEAKAHVERMRVARAGYKPCSGPYAESSSGEISQQTPEAEIWRMPVEKWRAEKRKRRNTFLTKFAHLRAVEASRNPRLRDFDPEIQRLIEADKQARKEER